MPVWGIAVKKPPVPPPPMAAWPPAAWWKADSLSLNDNDPVSSFVSSEGNNYDLVAAGALRPTFKTGIQNGLPAVRFANDFIQAGNVGTAHSDRYVTMHFVLTVTGAATQTCFGLVDDPTDQAEGWQAPSGMEFRFRQNLTPDHSPEFYFEGDNNWVEKDYTGIAVFTLVRDGAGVDTCSVWRNGVLETLNKTGFTYDQVQNDLDCFRFGDRMPSGTSGSPWYGDLFEFLFYESVLSQADREANIAALMTKWGI